MQQEAERTEEVYSDVHEHELELEVTAMAVETSDATRHAGARACEETGKDTSIAWCAWTQLRTESEVLCFVRKARVHRQLSGMNRSRPNEKQTMPMESEEGRLLTGVP